MWIVVVNVWIMCIVVVDIWIKRSDNLVETKMIGSDHSFKLLAGFFMSTLLFSRHVEYPEKTKISFKTRPNLKKTYWSMLIMHNIFDLMGNDLRNWFMTYLWLELRWNTCLFEIYTPLRGFSLFEWIQCFLWCFLETKCEMILTSFFGSENSIIVHSFLIVAFLKNVSD